MGSLCMVIVFSRLNPAVNVMSDFKKQLNDEMGKQEADKKSVKPPATPSRRVLFSFKTFFVGLVFCCLFLSGAIGWAYFSADKINANIKASLPSKTAVVVVQDAETFRLGDTQPVLRMPDATEPVKPSEEENAIQAMIVENTETPATTESEPAPTLSEKPSLAIIITDLGLSAKNTDEIIQNFPKGVSFAFSPYADNLDMLARAASEKGHEAWLMLPMETGDYPNVDPGPLTLLSSGNITQNIDRVEQIITGSQGFKGFIATKGHIFKNEDSNINPAIQKIFDNKLAIIDSNNTPQSFVYDIAYKNDYPYGKVNFWLDDDLSPLALNQRIRQIIEYAEAQKSAVVMLRPTPASLKALQKFLNSAAAEKFQLVPATSLIKNAE